MSYTFHFKISDEQLGEWIVKMLEVDDCIGAKEALTYVGFERCGSNTFVEFSTPNGDGNAHGK